MAKAKEWNHSQRVVASVGLGLLLFVIARAVGVWLIAHDPDGWFNYAPGGGVIVSDGGLNWWEVLTWVVAVSLWSAASLALFRPAGTSAETTRPVDGTTTE